MNTAFMGLSLASFIRYTSLKRNFYQDVYNEVHTIINTNLIFEDVLNSESKKLKYLYKKAGVSNDGLVLLKQAINETLTVFMDKYSNYNKDPLKYTCLCDDIVKSVKRNKAYVKSWTQNQIDKQCQNVCPNSHENNNSTDTSHHTEKKINKTC